MERTELRLNEQIHVDMDVLVGSFFNANILPIETIRKSRLLYFCKRASLPYQMSKSYGVFPLPSDVFAFASPPFLGKVLLSFCDAEVNRPPAAISNYEEQICSDVNKVDLAQTCSFIQLGVSPHYIFSLFEDHLL